MSPPPSDPERVWLKLTAALLALAVGIAVLVIAIDLLRGVLA